jgi:hypothetical protein
VDHLGVDSACGLKREALGPSCDALPSAGVRLVGVGGCADCGCRWYGCCVFRAARARGCLCNHHVDWRSETDHETTTELDRQDAHSSAMSPSRISRIEVRHVRVGAVVVSCAPSFQSSVAGEARWAFPHCRCFQPTTRVPFSSLS